MNSQSVTAPLESQTWTSIRTATYATTECDVLRNDVFDDLLPTVGLCDPNLEKHTL